MSIEDSTMTSPLAAPKAAPVTRRRGAYRHLGWAGVELRWGTHRLLIDPLENVAPLAGVLGAPRRPLERSEPVAGMTTDVLLTHAHADHFDAPAIARQLQDGGAVWVAASLADEVARHGLSVRPVAVGETYRVGPFAASPVPASDGFGDAQVSWVVGSGERRVLHAGDTLWHGHWWAIAATHAPIDIAFLPINGFGGWWPGRTRADVPGSLTPHQAVEAAHVLGARAICPIHYGVFHNPPHYVEWPEALDTLREAAGRRGIVVAGSTGTIDWGA